MGTVGYDMQPVSIIIKHVQCWHRPSFWLSSMSEFSPGISIIKISPSSSEKWNKSSVSIESLIYWYVSYLNTCAEFNPELKRER